MMKIVLVVLALIVSLTASDQVWAQSSWNELIKEIDRPVTQSPSGGEVEMLQMPDMDSVNEQQSAAGDQSALFVPDYQCKDPKFPKCVWDMRTRPRLVDLQNCRDLTRAYLMGVASYQNCVERRTKKHARRVVDVFNCLARGHKDCPYVYGN